MKIDTKWKEEYRLDYKGIINDEMIENSINCIQAIIDKAVKEREEAIVEEINKLPVVPSRCGLIVKDSVLSILKQTK